MVLKSPLALLFLLAGLASVTAFATMPRDGIHPLAVLASLLPLQLAAVLWAMRHHNTEA